MLLVLNVRTVLGTVCSDFAGWLTLHTYKKKKQTHQKSEVEVTLKIILPGICSLPRLVPLIFPLNSHWVHPLPHLTGKQEMCCEPWFPGTLQLTSLTPDPSPSILGLSDVACQLVSVPAPQGHVHLYRPSPRLERLEESRI